MKMSNLGIAFLLEMAMLAIYGYFGYHLLSTNAPLVLRIALAITFPVVIAIIWGYFLAPRATHRLKLPWLLIIKLIIMTIGVGMLWQLQKTSLAVIAAIIIAIHYSLAAAWKQI